MLVLNPWFRKPMAYSYGIQQNEIKVKLIQKNEIKVKLIN